jgi:hypothetical protein
MFDSSQRLAPPALFGRGVVRPSVFQPTAEDEAARLAMLLQAEEARWIGRQVDVIGEPVYPAAFDEAFVN